MASSSEKHICTDKADSNESVKPKGTINEKALLRKLDYRLLPPLTILYLLSFLDRSNVGNARLEGMADDINMCMFSPCYLGSYVRPDADDDVRIAGDQYLTGLTLYFIGYVLFEIPCNVSIASPERTEAPCEY